MRTVRTGAEQRLDSCCSVLGLREMALPTITILILLHLSSEVTLNVVVADLGHIDVSDSVIWIPGPFVSFASMLLAL